MRIFREEMETDNLYARAPLDLAVQHIRLVEIQPGDESETIQCKFHRFPLSECPEYIALSYTWGPPKVYKQILVDDAPFPLRRNLWWFLYYTRLQNQNQNQLFWIDAMCINQLNNQERNHQVRLMGQIYSMAKSVAVWLGEAQDDSDLAMDFVETKGLAPLKAKSGRFQPIWNWSQGKALLQLCERSYWSRVWVVQEIMHAQDLTVFSSSKSFHWQNLKQIFQKLREIESNGHIVHHPNAAAVLASPASVLIEAKSAWAGKHVPLISLLSTYRNLQSSDIRDKVIGLLSLASDSKLVVVDYSLSLDSFFWSVVTGIWEMDCSGKGVEMMKVAEILKETLKLHVSNVELASKIYKVTGVPHDELNTPWSPRKRIEAQQKLSQEFDSLFENPTSSRVASNVDCQRVAQSDLAVQEWFAEEVQPALKVRLVGKKRDSLEIKEEYSKSDSRYYAQTAALPLKYSHYRPIKSDTSNGWRAVGFAYFEALLNFRKTSPLEEEIRRITSMNDLLRNFGGFATWMFGDMVEVTTNLLKALAEKLQSSFRDAKHLLRQRFNEPRISKSITQHLRLLASSFMRVNPDLYQVALPDGLGIDRYAKDFIESPSQEIDHLGMALLVEVLLKPIQFDLQIKYVNGGKDRALASKGPPKTFQEDSFSGCSKNVGLQTIYLLYRPGHYDILYKAPVKSSPVNSSPVQYKRDPNKRVRHRGEKAVAPQQVSHHLDSPPTIERPILQFSQHNIAHYKHPDFQPEQWTPEPQTALTWR